MTQHRHQTFDRSGRLIHEEIVDVPDDPPTREQQFVTAINAAKSLAELKAALITHMGPSQEIVRL